MENSAIFVSHKIYGINIPTLYAEGLISEAIT
jgi:hypothetical protein